MIIYVFLLTLFFFCGGGNILRSLVKEPESSTREPLLKRVFVAEKDSVGIQLRGDGG